MLEVLFDIPTLKKLYPELNRCFGFTYDDISNELTQVYAQKVFNLTQEEKELANQCKSDDGWGVDAVKFALATNENIAVAVPDSFNPATIMESYAAKLHNEESASCALLFMAALLYRGKITEAPISEGENDNMLYQQYIHEVRPDMLKLYIALNQPKQKNGKDFITDIKIAAGGNSPILINNKNSWLENRLNDYLHQYLGVNSLEEAQDELHFIYGDKKVGSKKIDPIQSLYICHKQKIRNCLLGIQFFICWLFIVFTVALYLQANKTGSTLFNTLTEKEKSEIISIPMDYRFMKNDEKLALIERISQHPDIKDKMLTDINYLKGISGTSMQTEKDNRESSLEVNIMNVPNNFFEFMNIPILSGHVLKTNSDMVADRKLVERIKKDLLGTTLYNYQDSYTVCGICSDFVADTYNQSQGFVFLPCDFKYYVGHCYLKCVPGKAEEVEAFVKKMLEENLPPSIQLHISTLQEDIHQAQAIENNMKGIILFFSFVSLIITLLGVYSAITLDTERRQKEVAIRKVNGAGLKQIIILFARTYIYQLVLSATMAFPLCYAILQLWKNMYIVFFNDGPLFWISIFIIVAVITTLTIIFRILKIARTNPAEVIKNE